jgi:hypothetical protein
MGRSPVHGVLPECIEVLRVSEVNSEPYNKIFVIFNRLTLQTLYLAEFLRFCTLFSTIWLSNTAVNPSFDELFHVQRDYAFKVLIRTAILFTREIKFEKLRQQIRHSLYVPEGVYS